jgi:DHA2 family methylenomycin A resistance protein-like MFS transporter
MLGLLRLGPHTGAGATWWDFAVAGAGFGLCLTPMTQVAVSAALTPRAGMASSVHNALRQFGQVLGVAVLGAIVYAHGTHGFVTGLHTAMWVSGAALLGAAVLAMMLLRPAAAAPPRASRTEPRALTTIRSIR